MNARWQLILGITTILAWGATLGLRAPQPTRTIYLVLKIDQIVDAAEYEALKKIMAPQAVVETQLANGRYVARTEDIVPLDGVASKAMVIIAFDNESKAKSFYNATKDVTALRVKASMSRSFIVGRCSEGGQLSSNC